MQCDSAKIITRLLKVWTCSGLTSHLGLSDFAIVAAFPPVTFTAGTCCEVYCDNTCANAFISSAGAERSFARRARVGVPTVAPSESDADT